MATVAPYELRLTAGPGDIDQLGHVNNVVYLKWVQEAAVAHWTAAAPAAAQDQLFWVVTRHEIDYKRPTYAGDEVIVRTWVGQAARRAFDRHTEIRRARDGKVLAAARTVWCPMSRATGRPVDVDDEVRAAFSVPGAD